jgi:Ankyrin repeats (3 copies)
LQCFYYSWSKKHSTDKSLAVAGATGSTALHVAAANGCTKVVELLLRNGALVDVKDKYGSTPLSVATAKNHTEIVNILETFRVFQVSTELQNLHLDSHQHRKIVPSKSKLNRLRRPSLPTELDGKASDSSVRTSLDHTPVRHSVHLSRMDDDYFDSSAEPPRATNLGSGHLSPAKSGEDSSGSADSSQFDTPPSSWEDNPDDQTMCEKDSFVSYSFEPETYVESLERRAYGSVSDDHFARHVRPQVDANGDSIFEQRASLDHFRPPVGRPSLSRSNSDLGKLRAAALMNAMAANSANSSGIEDDIVPRPSLVLDDGPEAEALRRFQEREVKKAWWGGFGGRKSVDVVGRRSTDHPMLSSRKSVDFRPSLDGISSLAKKSMDSLSRRSNDYAAFEGSEWEIDVTQPSTRKQRSNSFLTRFWS